MPLTVGLIMLSHKPGTRIVQKNGKRKKGKKTTAPKMQASQGV
jgi:hypothetical protein